MTKRMAIVSSYDVICGNAAFSDVLIGSINSEGTGWKAFPVDLNLTLNQNLGRKEVKASFKDFDRMAKELSNFDAVNVQFEAGLYGLLPNHVFKRLKTILTANEKTFLTYHSPRTLTNFKPRKEAIRQALRGKFIAALHSELEFYRVNFDVRMNRKIIGFLKRKDIPVVVHTIRSKEMLQKVFGLQRVQVHPIILAEKAKLDAAAAKNIRQTLGLDAETKYVGLFGFISQYKGHKEALDALELLPSDYKFVIAGRIHPQSLGNPDASKYVSDLVNKIKSKKKLRGRVQFVGELDDKTFEALVSAVDCCLLPYHEVGQDGSGIASICFEVGRKVVASNSYAFDELIKLVPAYKTYRFDIENSFEMASQIVRAVNSDKEMAPSLEYSLITQREIYLRATE
jgi:glycosyltransferase involved in cell wall biosynthesis